MQALNTREPLSEDEALAAMRDRHALYARYCGPRFADRPFRSRFVPGWVYYPEQDRVEAE